ncbi:hypothetical protein ABZX65_20265 [Streptomyces sp. NPDC003300]|uniref:hypothetical protein n=1 Tax=unclassified Streptomyces TaxID=2593676 RepID=UPI0033B0A752
MPRPAAVQATPVTCQERQARARSYLGAVAPQALAQAQGQAAPSGRSHPYTDTYATGTAADTTSRTASGAMSGTASGTVSGARTAYTDLDRLVRTLNVHGGRVSRLTGRQGRSRVMELTGPRS